MKYLFIVNPKAGSGRALRYRSFIEEYMDGKKLDYKILLTKSKNHASRIVLENEGDFDIFVAVGGDGTNKEVAQGVLKTKNGILAILPLGTANDLAKVIYKNCNLREILDRITSAKESELDIIRVNDDYSFNIASIGFDAQVIVNYNNIKFFKGRIKYFMAVLYSIFRIEYRQVEISLDGQILDEEITLLAMGNGSHYGNFFKILPDAKIDDGYIHICLIRKLSKLKIILLSPILLLGKHRFIKKYVGFYKCEEILIKSKEKIFINLDGEIIGNTSLAKLEIYGKIKIIY